MKDDKKYLTKKSQDISKWYGEIIEKADLASHAPVKGCMIIKPYGYALWEKIQSILDKTFKSDGVKNVYFPLFIPNSLIQKEKQHVSGFSPELAVVTHAGGEELPEPLIVRPTSETIMYQTFASWIASYKDLPLKINQWCNVVRWEKRTYPFLRTSEFLWQEGHTVHETEGEAMEMVYKALNWYKDIYENYLGISVYVGEKSETEKFAGAKRTFSIELVIPNGKALQGATSHNLGQNFANSFDITFSDTENQKKYPFQTSWGLSTRAIGGLILSQGDDHGLVLPPRIAPIQVILFTVFAKEDKDNGTIRQYTKRIEQYLVKSSLSYIHDENPDKSFGYRISESEIKGIPIRLEVGVEETAKKYVLVSRRDTFTKEKVPVDNLVSYIEDLIKTMQDELLQKSKDLREDLTLDVKTFDEFKKVLLEKRCFLRAFWCESKVCELKIKEQTKATTRVLELERLEVREEGVCIYCGNKATRKWLFAQSY